MIDFPSSPVNGQLFTSGGITWVFNSTKSVWEITVAGSLIAHSHIQSDIINLVSDLAGKAALSHTHTAANISDSTAAGRAMLLAANAAAQTALLSNFTAALKGLVPLSGGGTVNFLRADGSWAPAGGGITLVPEQASTSGTVIDFTGIPASVKRITVMFASVSWNTIGEILIRIGDAGGFETTGYDSGNLKVDPTPTVEASTAGFVVGEIDNAGDAFSGSVILSRQDESHTWVSQGILNNGGNSVHTSAGVKQLSAELTQVRITTASGQTFDAGSISISYE